MKLANVPLSRKKRIPREKRDSDPLADESKDFTSPWWLLPDMQSASLHHHMQTTLRASLFYVTTCSPIWLPGDLLAAASQAPTQSTAERDHPEATKEGGTYRKQRLCGTTHGPLRSPSPPALPSPHLGSREAGSVVLLGCFLTLPLALPIVLAASLFPFCRIWLLCFVL